MVNDTTHIKINQANLAPNEDNIIVDWDGSKYVDVDEPSKDTSSTSLTWNAIFKKSDGTDLGVITVVDGEDVFSYKYSSQLAAIEALVPELRENVKWLPRDGKMFEDRIFYAQTLNALNVRGLSIIGCAATDTPYDQADVERAVHLYENLGLSQDQYLIGCDKPSKHAKNPSIIKSSEILKQVKNSLLPTTGPQIDLLILTYTGYSASKYEKLSICYNALCGYQENGDDTVIDDLGKTSAMSTKPDKQSHHQLLDYLYKVAWYRDRVSYNVQIQLPKRILCIINAPRAATMFPGHCWGTIDSYATTQDMLANQDFSRILCSNIGVFASSDKGENKYWNYFEKFVNLCFEGEKLVVPKTYTEFAEWLKSSDGGNMPESTFICTNSWLKNSLIFS